MAKWRNKDSTDLPHFYHSQQYSLQQKQIIRQIGQYILHSHLLKSKYKAQTQRASVRLICVRHKVEIKICSYQLLPLLITQSPLMKSENTKQVMDVLYANEPTSRNFAQHFEYAHHSITHQHQVEVALGPQEHHFEIRNHFTVQTQKGLEKVIEIVLENRIIKIIDTFQSTVNLTAGFRREEILNQNGLTVKRPQNIKKYTIFKSSEEQEAANKIKDTKNVVKNIIRLFQCWLEESLPKHREVYEELQAFIGKIKYNNHLIMRMVKDETIRLAFLQFGLREGKEFIDKSKIHDKKTHFEALQRYVQLFEVESRCDNSGEKMNSTAEAPVMVKQQ